MDTPVSLRTSAPCPLEECLRLLAGAWTPRLLWLLAEEPHRFGELRRLLPTASPKMLTTRLRELEARGLVTRRVLPTSPPSVRYSLAPLGREFKPMLEAMAGLGSKLLEKTPA